MKYRHCLVVAPFLASLATTCLGQQHQQGVGSLASSAKAADAPFLVKPYLQLGDVPPGGWAGISLALARRGRGARLGGGVSARGRGILAVGHGRHVTTDGGARRRAAPGLSRRLEGLGAGGCVRLSGAEGRRVVFSAEAARPKGAGQPYRFAVFGDCGAGTAEQKAVAYPDVPGSARLRPDHGRHRLHRGRI